MNLILIVLALAILSGCDMKKPVKIGFVGGLTGKMSDLGVSGRDGAMLAVEEANEKGGIQGRPVILVAKDDRHNHESAISAVKELIGENVGAIIGPMTSTMAEAVIPLVNRAMKVMVSPTVSSGKFLGIDDYFFMMQLPTVSATEALARYVFNDMRIKRVTSVYDLANSTFSAEWVKNFRTGYEKLGGEFLSMTPYDFRQTVSYLDLSKKVLAEKPGGLLVVASAPDVAAICQQLLKLKAKISVFSAGQGLTVDIIKYGGKAVEGVVGPHVYNRESNEEPYHSFRHRFRERFGKDPDFAAILAYESARTIIISLEQNPDPAALKETIIAHRVFPGVQGNYHINKTGDVERTMKIIAIRDGKFIVLK